MLLHIHLNYFQELLLKAKKRGFSIRDWVYTFPAFIMRISKKTFSLIDHLLVSRGIFQSQWWWLISFYNAPEGLYIAFVDYQSHLLTKKNENDRWQMAFGRNHFTGASSRLKSTYWIISYPNPLLSDWLTCYPTRPTSSLWCATDSEALIDRH